MHGVSIRYFRCLSERVSTEYVDAAARVLPNRGEERTAIDDNSPTAKFSSKSEVLTHLWRDNFRIITGQFAQDDVEDLVGVIGNRRA